MKNKNKDLLKKKLGEMGPDEWAQLEKVFGTWDRPFPMYGVQREEINGQVELEARLSRVAARPNDLENSKPIMVYSERPYNEVAALMYCDMPVPSMLPLFMKGIERRLPASTNRTQMMIGDPGLGKSFLGALQSRLRSTAPAEVYDCGGKSMRDLLFEMVLDFGAGDALPKAIDKRLATGTLEPLSLALLKSINGDKAEIVSIDEKTGDILSIDWGKLKNAGTETVERAFDKLKQVSKIEGLDNAGGNALGMNAQYGVLIRKWISGEELSLDEYNKSRENTDDSLQTVWQFMIGEIDECTVENTLKNKDAASGPSNFTFRREDMKAGFFVTLTGNKKADGVTTREISRSANSRLSPDILPDPLLIDWQHRLCQMMTGVPISTLYLSNREKADENPVEFGKWMMYLREQKAKMEGTVVPEYQRKRLENWRDMFDASEDLARIFEGWAKLTDVNKILESGHSELLTEVDEEYSNKLAMDFRKLKQYLDAALQVMPKMQKETDEYGFDFGKWDKPPVFEKPDEVDVSLHAGTRLAEYLENVLYNTTKALGKDNLYEAIRDLMDKNNLRDIALKEAARSNRKSIERAMNISAFADTDVRRQAKLAQKIFCEYLRQMDKNLAKVADDRIVTPQRFEDALRHVRNEDTAEDNRLFVPNRNIDDLGMNAKPVVETYIYDKARLDLTEEDDEAVLKYENMVSHQDLLASLALPTVSEKNLKAVWERNIEIRDETMNAAPGNMPPLDDKYNYDVSLRVAQNQSETGVALTTLVARYGETDSLTPTHIIRNEKTGETVVVGDAVPVKLRQAFNQAGITFIDRDEKRAKEKLDEALLKMGRGLVDRETVSGKVGAAGLEDALRAEEQKILLSAFGYRVSIDEKSDETLADSMLRRDRVDEPFLKYVVKSVQRKAG